MVCSSSSTTANKNYDVFLSFRGEDTRSNFTSHLHGLLSDRGINVFIDDDLKRGDEISPSLLNAVEESTISVIIFSEGYASSRWCLQELVKILDCKKKFGQVVLPVFYHVYPSRVRNQTGAFGKAFDELIQRCKDKEQTERWRNSLTEAANISGLSLYEIRSENSLAREIVKDILEILNYLSPNDNKGLVGVQTTIDHIVEQFLHNNNLNIVRTIGIWGMGGIGKTTIAEAIFNRMRTQFEDAYFARNVREESERPDRLIPLRQDLLSKILKDQHSNINSTFKKRRLGRKRVFIVFDDITSSSQIEFLIGDLNCLGLGSRIIITTRNKQVLRNCGLNDNLIYKMEGLSHSDATWLFSWHAFRQNRPNVDYDELSNRVVHYARGLPLALKVLGSFLLCKPKDVWENAISKLEIIPHEDIQEVLKVSFNGLNDDEKNIFLDIACFLKQENKDFVIEFLNACGFFPNIGISVLMDKCLLNILDDNKITMHDLLQEMGWEIVRQESTRDPGKRSRLWFHGDIHHVLEETTGTTTIEGICFDMSKETEILDLEPHALAKMRQLRFFKLHNSRYEESNINKVDVSKSLNSISTQLRYLCWHGCPLKSLQSNFQPKKLIALDMPHSNIEQLWIGIKLVQLKHIDLSYSKHLSKIDDLLWAPNLESLILEGCTNLFHISSSVQCLHKLVILNLRHCKSLRSLPEISCNIKELYLDETAIQELPSSIENLTTLVILTLKNCSMLESLPKNICQLKSVEQLDLSGCTKLGGLPDDLGNLGTLKVLQAERLTKSSNLTDSCITKLPSSLGQFSLLESLLLSRNYFECLPTSIIDLSKLSYLDLSYCERLQFLPELPYNLQDIDAHNCTSLEASSSLSTLFLSANLRNKRVNFSNCFRLDQDAFKEILRDALQKILPMRTESNPRPSACICYPGNKILEWFTFQRRGSFITINMLEDLFPYYLDGLSFAMCAVVEFRNYHNDNEGLVVGCDWIFRSVDGGELYVHGSLKGWDYGNGPNYLDSDYIFLGYDFSLQFPELDRLRLLNSYNYNMTIKFYVETLNTEQIAYCNVKRCGVQYLVLKEEEEEEE